MTCFTWLTFFLQFTDSNKLRATFTTYCVVDNSFLSSELCSDLQDSQPIASYIIWQFHPHRFTRCGTWRNVFVKLNFLKPVSEFCPAFCLAFFLLFLFLRFVNPFNTQSCGKWTLLKIKSFLCLIICYICARIFSHAFLAWFNLACPEIMIILSFSYMFENPVTCIIRWIQMSCTTDEDVKVET